MKKEYYIETNLSGSWEPFHDDLPTNGALPWSEIIQEELDHLIYTNGVLGIAKENFRVAEREMV